MTPDIVLSAKKATWRMNDHASEADSDFAAVRKTVLEQADYRCSYCELRSDKWQEVHHEDDDHHNNDMRNLRCACPLCHQVFHVGLAGLHDGGIIIYAPEFTQVQLNMLTLAIWLAVSGRAVYAAKAREVYQDLENRRYMVTSIFRDWARHADVKLQEPFQFSADMLGNGLIMLDDKDYEDRQNLLGGLRLLPTDMRFKSQIEHWVKYFGSKIPSQTWGQLVPNIENLAAKARS